MMPFDRRSSFTVSLFALVMKASACREPTVDQFGSQCNLEAVAACALARSGSDGRGGPESACVVVCKQSKQDPALKRDR